MFCIIFYAYIQLATKLFETCDNSCGFSWFHCQFLLSHAYYKQHKAYILRLDKYFFHRTAFDMNFLRRIISSARIILLSTVLSCKKKKKMASILKFLKFFYLKRLIIPRFENLPVIVFIDINFQFFPAMHNFCLFIRIIILF